MKPRRGTVLKIAGLVVLALALVVVSVAAMPTVKGWLKFPAPAAEAAGKAEADEDLRLAREGVLRLDLAQVQALGIKTTRAQAPVALPKDEQAKWSRQLELSGSLAPDTDRLAPVRSRFPGEVVEIARVRDPDTPPGQPTRFRPVQSGDRVEQDQLLAVVWSSTLGQQKSALVDALSRQRLDQETLERYRDLYNKGAIPERSLREAERNVDADQIAVDTAVRTLQSWRLNDKEIDAIRQEAEKLARKRAAQGAKGRDKEPEQQSKDWARVEVRAPIAGVIVEKNLANANSAIIDTTTNLFMISDPTRLTVWANAFEEDVATLQALPKPIPWTIHIGSGPQAETLQGTIGEIRPFIDPTQHTALIKGFVANPSGRLLSGQFVTVTVTLPPAPDQVTVPTSALVEDGDESILFVQHLDPDPNKRRYALRHVAVARRGRDMVFLRWPYPDLLIFLSAWPTPTAAVNLALAGLFEGSQDGKPNPLRAVVKPEEELVVTAGALELRSELKDRQDKPREEPKK